MDSDHEDQGSCVWHGCDLPEGLLTPCLLDSRVLHHVPDSNPKKLQVVSLLQSLGLPVSSWSCLAKLWLPSTGVQSRDQDSALTATVTLLFSTTRDARTEKLG